MKYITLILFTVIAATSTNAQSIDGIWNTGEDNTKIEITEDNGVFSGKILSSDNSNAKLGNEILKNLTFNNGEYKGKMYAAKKEKWYDAVLKENGNQLEVKIKVGMMKKSLSWSKE